MRNNSVKVPGFGRRLKTARERSGMTQQGMADSLGLALRTYQRYEDGDTEPTLHGLVSLSVILGVTSDHLLGLDDEAPAD